MLIPYKDNKYFNIEEVYNNFFYFNSIFFIKNILRLWRLCLLSIYKKLSTWDNDKKTAE